MIAGLLPARPTPVKSQRPCGRRWTYPSSYPSLPSDASASGRWRPGVDKTWRPGNAGSLRGGGVIVRSAPPLRSGVWGRLARRDPIWSDKRSDHVTHPQPTSTPEAESPAEIEAETGADTQIRENTAPSASAHTAARPLDAAFDGLASAVERLEAELDQRLENDEGLREAAASAKREAISAREAARRAAEEVDAAMAEVRAILAAVERATPEDGSE